MFKGSSGSGDRKGRTILSLDGGGQGGASQLRILLEILHRVEYDMKRQADGGLEITRPCECFDMIGGSGTGGLIAILFVVFGLSAADALEAFAKISQEVLDEDINISPKERNDALRCAVEELLKKYEIRPNLKLTDVNERDGGCKLAIPIMQASNIGVPVWLRNHEIRTEKRLNITIVDAVLATCSLPPLFEPVRVREAQWDYSFVSADEGLCNPTLEIIKSAYEAFGGDESVACLLSLGAGHQGVIRLLSAGNYEESALDSNSGMKAVMRRMALDCERVARELDDRMMQSGLYLRFSVDQGMQVSRKVAGTRAKSQSFKDPLDSNSHIMANTLAYLEHPKVGRDVDYCVQMITTREGLRTLCELHQSGGQQIVPRSLPPMVGHFVKRKEPWKTMCSIFFTENGTISIDRTVMVISGMGGLGKTQLALHFAREFRNHFSSIIFVNASTEDSIQADILRYVRSNPKYSKASFEDALEVLARPLPTESPYHSPGTSSQPAKSPWLIIYDNCDDAELDLASHLPGGSHGCIIVTTRMVSVQKLDPGNALDLGMMSPEEAVELLLYYSGQRRRYPSATSSSTTEEDENSMRKIAKSLGYLPLALAQAASHIHETGDTWSKYHDDLRTSEGSVRLLSTALKSVGDSYNTSVFAAIQSTYTRLLPNVQNIFHLLGFLWCSDFPMEMIAIAAKDRFQKQYRDYHIPREPYYERCKALLEDYLCPGGKWDALAFESAIVALRNYSLIALSPAQGTMLIYMHPVVATWARSLISEPESRHRYIAASHRIAAAGACQSSGVIDQHLIHHILSLRLRWEIIHPNDKAAFAVILHRTGEFHAARKLRAAVLKDLPRYYNTALGMGMFMHVKASLELADSYMELYEYQVALKIFHGMMREAWFALGMSHPLVIEVFSRYADLLRVGETKFLLEHAYSGLSPIYRDALRKHGAEDEVTIAIGAKLAMICYSQKSYMEAEQLQRTVLVHRRKHFGDDDRRTIEACENMGRIYVGLEKTQEAISLQRDALFRSERLMGPDHRDTIRAKSGLAMTLLHMQRYNEALEMYEFILQSRIRVLGDEHVDTANAKVDLARTLRFLGKWEEARRFASEGFNIIRRMVGKKSFKYLAAEQLVKKLRRAYQLPGNQPPALITEGDYTLAPT